MFTRRNRVVAIIAALSAIAVAGCGSSSRQHQQQHEQRGGDKLELCEHLGGGAVGC